MKSHMDFYLKTIKRQCNNCVIDVIEYLEQHNEKQATLIFLDAKKAFDS